MKLLFSPTDNNAIVIVRLWFTTVPYMIKQPWTEILHRLPIKPALSQPQSPVTLPRVARQSNINWKPNNKSWLFTLTFHFHSLLSSWIKFKCTFSSATSLRILVPIVHFHSKYTKQNKVCGSSWVHGTKIRHIFACYSTVSAQSPEPYVDCLSIMKSFHTLNWQLMNSCMHVCSNFHASRTATLLDSDLPKKIL